MLVDDLNATCENGKLTFKTDRFSVYAFAVKATGIKITTAPTKTVYTVGETFDKSGMVVELIYADGSKKVITDYKAPATALTKADQEITVTYGNFTAKQKITVKEASASTTPADTTKATIKVPKKKLKAYKKILKAKGVSSKAKIKK